MTRPIIMRADTLDLQDHDNPSAAEHARHPTPSSGNAPHVAAQVHQVLEERHSEEQALADAWNIAGNLAAEPGAIDLAQTENAGHGAASGGAMNSDDNGDGEEQEVDVEDDMMDRISSSPSIDDGGYSPFSTKTLLDPAKLWPERSSSLHSVPNQAQSFCQSFNKTAYTVPLLREEPDFFSSKHHQSGRYNQELEHDSDQKEHEAGDDASELGTTQSSRKEVELVEGLLCSHSFAKMVNTASETTLQRSPSPETHQCIALETLLLPAHDPCLKDQLSPLDSWKAMFEVDSDLSDAPVGRPYDDENDAFLDLEDRFIDSGWGGECLRETEDIDFEFVYALHTFVATVEGQANATKGDTMVLLDDSNSYWWLVRVVKDSSIGYLPAEHIETPTERLARLNKHRNIDLSATMLSDNSEKSRNPLKKAMRRRNAKTVQFAAPTYVEASDYDYSTDEEENIIDPYGTANQTEDTAQHQPEKESEDPKAETKEPIAEVRTSTSSQRASFDREQAAAAAQALEAAGINGDDWTAPIVVKEEAAPIKTGSSKKRNTDSWVKDDTIETRKITLTPGLLREESIASSGRSPDSPRSNSFESLQKTTSPPDQPKKESKETKKKETKKSGGIMNLFQRKKKDKKAKDDGNETDAEKTSGEVSREFIKVAPQASDKTALMDREASGLQVIGSTGSLQHVPSAEQLREPSQEANLEFLAELPGSEVAQEMPATRNDSIELQPQVDNETGQQEKSLLSNTLSPITNMLKAGDGHEKPKKAKRSKQRVELDDFDSPMEEAKDPFDDPQDDGEQDDRLLESPVEISSHAFMHGTDTVHIPVLGDGENDEGEEEQPESLTSSPSLIEHPAEPSEEDGEMVEDDDATPTARSPQPSEERSKAVPTSMNEVSADRTANTSTPQQVPSRPSPTVAQQAWSDERLRAWLEDGSEIRDMLVMINDKTGVTPASADHPLMNGLFVEQRKGVQDMMGQLDGLLGSYLQRKGVRF